MTASYRLPSSKVISLALPSTFLLLLLLLPWLNPFNDGPTPSVPPLLVSWTCAALLLLLPSAATQPGRSAPDLAIFSRLGAVGALIALSAWLAGQGAALQTTDTLALGMGLLAVLACAMCFVHADENSARLVARAWLAAGLISALMGWLQYTGTAGALSPWVGNANLGEAFGNLRQRNLYASLTSISLCALVWLARRDPWFARSAVRLVLPAVLLAAGNALSHSRTGLFELLLVLALAGIWGLFREREARWALVPVLPAYLLAALALPRLFSAFALPGIFTRLAEGAPGCSSRSTLWSNVLTLIAEKPWTGWGWGQLDQAHYQTLYDGPRFCDILDNAHNLPLHLAVELGVPVALIVCGAVLWATLRARPWQEAEPLRQLAWSVLAILALHSLLEYPLWYGPFQMALGICLGLLWKVRRRRPAMNFGATPSSSPALKPGDEAAGSAVGKPAVTALRVSLASVLLVGVALTALDYRAISQIYLPPEQRAAAYRDDTLGKVRQVWLFDQQALFAELTLTPLTAENAEWTYTTARQLLAFSPEPRVAEKLIESAVMLGRNDEALAQLLRYRAAFPADHARWAAELKPAPVLAASGG